MSSELLLLLRITNTIGQKGVIAKSMILYASQLLGILSIPNVAIIFALASDFSIGSCLFSMIFLY